MKRKKLYVMCASAITACIIYTSVSFNNPTDKEQSSIFTNTLELVKNSFSTIDEGEDPVIFQKSGFSLLPSAISSSDTNPITADVTKEAIDEEIVTISSLTQEQVQNVEPSKNDKKDTKESSKKTSKKSSKKEVKEDEIVTTLSISESSCDEKDIAISVASSYVNIREDATTDSKVLGKLYKNNAAHILETKGDWFYIESGNVKGYVKAEFVKTGLSEDELAQYGTLTATVNTDGLNVREKASTESNRVDVIYLGENYPVLKQKKDWVKIHVEDDNVKGYVKTEYVQLALTFQEAISIEEEAALKKAEEEQKTEKQAVSTGSKIETSYGKGTDYSKDELALLACLIHAEAGNQSYEGKLAVANVVLNRVKSNKYPNSIYKVIYQSGQFSVASSGSLDKQLSNYTRYSSSSQKLSIQAAKDALAGVNNVGNRLSFNRYSSSVANKHSSNGIKIDDQFFW